MPYYLYKDLAAPGASSQKVVRAAYSTLGEAQAQAQADLAQGYRVVCIEKSKQQLDSLERGELVNEF